MTEQDCPHLLFYGPSGSGKKTLIMALIKEMFGSAAEKVSLLILFILWKLPNVAVLTDKMELRNQYIVDC